MALLARLRDVLRLSQQVPVYGPTVEPRLPGDTITDVEGEEQPNFTQDIPDFNRPQITGYQKRPTKLGQFAQALPGALTTAIQAAAQPNVAFGGATDVLRSMAAVPQIQQQRDMLNYAIGRQRRGDALQEMEQQRKMQRDEELARHAMETEQRALELSGRQMANQRLAEVTKREQLQQDYINKGVARYLTPQEIAAANVGKLTPETQQQVRDVTGVPMYFFTQEEMQRRGKVPWMPPEGLGFQTEGKPIYISPEHAALVTQANKPERVAPTDQRIFDAATRSVAASAGIDASKLDASKPLLEQLPLAVQKKAIESYEQLKKTRDPEVEARTRLLNAQTSLQLEQLKQARSPENVDSIVRMMQANPDVWFDKALDESKMRGPVERAWTQQTGLPLPRKLGPEMKRAEEASEIALEHLDRVRALMKDPIIQKRLGPILGRLGNVEQAVGSAQGLTPEESQKVQEFRTSLNYFFFREGRALLGGRPAERLMREFSKTSANAAMAMPLLEGSLAGAEAMAKASITAANNYRFGGRKRGGEQGAPTGARMERRNKRTGEFMYSLDGGATWQPGRLPMTPSGR